MSASGHVIHKEKSQTPGQDSLLLFLIFFFLWNTNLSLKLGKNPPTTTEQVFIAKGEEVSSNACSVTALTSKAQQGVPPVYLKRIFKCWHHHSSKRSLWLQ